MMRILLVDDEGDKRQQVCALIASLGINVDEVVETVGDVVSAKRSLKLRKFQLVILDLNIPPRADRPVQIGEGLSILRFLSSDGDVQHPDFVIGLTAYDSGFDAAAEYFSSPLWKLVRFDYSDLTWRKSLQTVVEYILARYRPPFGSDGATYHSDVAVIAALPEELQALTDISPSWTEVPVPFDHSKYRSTVIRASGSTVKIVATSSSRMGMPNAAIAAAKLVHNFRPALLSIVGICGGVSGKTRIGDVIVADPCWDWGSGKWADDGAQGKFIPAAYQHRLDADLRSVVERVAESGCLLDLYSSWRGPKPDAAPTVLIEAMVSGAAVLQSQASVDSLRADHKNIVGFDMESYAVFTVAKESCAPRPECISIKSVCDFGDARKTDDFHDYAAYISAGFFKEFLIASRS